MNSKDYEVAKLLKRKLSEVVQLIDFRVFGSRARGETYEYSDLDVFIEVEDLVNKLKEKICKIVCEVRFENSIFISALIFTRHELENSPLSDHRLL